MNKKMKMFNLKNIILISKMRNNTDHGHFFEIGVAAALEFRALVRTPLDTSNSELLLLLMMEGKSCADVATLRRRDVAAC